MSFDARRQCIVAANSGGWQVPAVRDGTVQDSRVIEAGKLAGPEESKLKAGDIVHESEHQRLCSQLQAAHDASQLSELPSEVTRAALNDLLV